MTSRVVRTSMRLRRRDPEDVVVYEIPIELQQEPPVAPRVVSAPPTIDVDAIEDDDDVVISTASAFAQAKSKSARSRAESGGSTGLSKSRVRRRSGSASVECDERNKLRNFEAVAPALVEEPKFNCPICICPVTEETTTKCGHIFCKGCIKKAIACQGKCPTCRKKVAPKDLIRVFLPSR